MHEAKAISPALGLRDRPRQRSPVVGYKMAASKCILVVSGSDRTLKHLGRLLRATGHSVFEAATGRDALEHIQSHPPDLVFLDLQLPDIGGRDLARILGSGPVADTTEVVVLAGPEIPADPQLAVGGSADEPVFRWSRADEIIGLVDDRLGVAPERSEWELSGPLCFEGVRIDPDTMSVEVEGRRVELTHKEFELLHVLAANGDRACTRDELRKLVWGDDAEVIGRTIDVLVSRLRSKLTEAGCDLVSTVRGVGYRFMAGPDA